MWWRCALFVPIVALALAAPVPAAGLALQFDSELIRLFVEPDTLEVDGIYRFLCDAGGRAMQTLFYPYPQDSLLGGARMVSLEARTPGGPWAPAGYQELPAAHGARWQVPFLESDSLEIRCVYRQALLGRYARYIVTTTRHWNRPLSHARFEIYLPAGARPERFSYPFTEEQGPAGPYWAYETEQFMPQEDIVVEWATGED